MSGPTIVPDLRVPSPCISICQFTRDGHCVGCSMTRAQKSAFKALSTPAQREGFIDMLIAQQSVMGGYGEWAPVYGSKCRESLATRPAPVQPLDKAG